MPFPSWTREPAIPVSSAQRTGEEDGIPKVTSTRHRTTPPEHQPLGCETKKTSLLNFRKIWGFTKFSLPDVEEGSKLGTGPRVIESQISLDLVLLVNSEENAHPLIDEITEIEYWLDLVNWLEWYGLDCPRLVDLSCYHLFIHSFIHSFLHSVSQWVSH